MRVNARDPKVIFSLHGDAVAVAEKLTNFNSELHFSLGEGRFNGEHEVCVMVPAVEFDPTLKALLREDGQQCVLYLDNQWNGFISEQKDNYPSFSLGETTYIGEFVEVPVTTAEHNGDYSKFGGRYFICRK